MKEPLELTELNRDAMRYRFVRQFIDVAMIDEFYLRASDGHIPDETESVKADNAMDAAILTIAAS